MSHEERRRQLLFALISRVLTDAEMGEVANWDYQLMVRQPPDDGGMSEFYSETEKRRQFADALLQQFKLRAASASADKP